MAAGCVGVEFIRSTLIVEPCCRAWLIERLSLAAVSVCAAPCAFVRRCCSQYARVTFVPAACCVLRMRWLGCDTGRVILRMCVCVCVMLWFSATVILCWVCCYTQGSAEYV